MVLQAAERSDNQMKEARCLGKSRKNPEADQKKKPYLGAGKHQGKANKEIPENELELKISELEFRRRQWLMHWQLEVIDMQHELYDMEQTLAKSIVRSDSAKARDKLHKKEAAHPQMTEEEIAKLPVRMRPRPKYAPYLTARERTEINTRSYEKVIQGLHNNPRQFDLFTPNPGSSPGDQMNHLEQYKLLLLRNPFYKHRERDEFLLKARIEPPWVSMGRGIAPKSMVVSARGSQAMTLPSVRPISMQNARQLLLSSGRVSDKSVSFDGSNEHPPSIVINNSDVPPKTHKTTPSSNQNEQLRLHSSQTDLRGSGRPRLPTVAEKNKEKPAENVAAKKVEKEHVNKAHAKHPKPRPATSTGSRSQHSGKTSPTNSTISSYPDSDTNERSNRKKAGIQEKHHQLPQLHKKNEPNILDDPNFRRQLISELDKKRIERIENTKWSLVKNAFKASTLLKVQMPDVIRDATVSKHKNRAIGQVQEHIKKREARNRALEEDNPARHGLAGARGLSQSLPVLTK